VSATEEIMAYHPTPILVVSSAQHRGELYDTYDALAAGAVDVLEKPLDGDDAEWERRLVQAVKLVSRIKVITHMRAKLARASRPAQPALPTRLSVPESTNRLRVVALGASTGGPGALREVLRQLPASFPLPVMIVMHIGEPFGAMIAEWLNSQSALTVRPARHEEPLPPPGQGVVLLAPPDHHLVLAEGRLHLSRAPERHSCRPSVDVLFESIAREVGDQALGCLLTGMGRDGAAGLLAMRQAGARTIAQDEATSVVFGMPREAIQLGAAQTVLPIGEIGRTIRAYVTGDGMEKLT
jgi:two-component system chemotaxis response regulator CheB